MSGTDYGRPIFCSRRFNRLMVEPSMMMKLYTFNLFPSSFAIVIDEMNPLKAKTDLFSAELTN